MATICGARALGLDDRIGSLEPGKQADIIAVDLDAIDLVPCYHPASHLVYAAGRRDVSHVWIAGELLVRDGELVRLDVDQLRSRVQGWHTQLSA
jgi:5-methylthioadenosine/S-adenosylhomocysteine deaminase